MSNPSNGPEANGTKIVSPEKSSGSSNGGQQSADAAVISSGVSLAVDPDAWSAVQERALVQALKTFPKETNQRWERVSAAVPGKSVLQCKKKFAMMKENFRNKKS